MQYFYTNNMNKKGVVVFVRCVVRFGNDGGKNRYLLLTRNFLLITRDKHINEHSAAFRIHKKMK